MVLLGQAAGNLRVFVDSHRVFLLVCCAILCSGSNDATGQTDEPPLVRVQSNSGGPYVGELVAENADTIEVFDFSLNRSVSVEKASVIRTENPITLDDAARYAGLSAVMGRQISLLSSRPAVKGKIAKISPQVVYLTLGEPSGLVVGQKVTVFRGEGDIVDPDTGKVLASERPKIAELEVTEVNENVSKARITGDLEVKLEVGDEVEPDAARLVVAVCPLSNSNGTSNATGISLAEELIGALVQRKVNVVERSAMDKVLAELLAQNTILFDEKSAQKLGKLTGATVVLTGMIVPEKSTGKAHLRLVDVQSGEILIAVSSPVKLSARSSTSSSPRGSNPGGNAKSSGTSSSSSATGSLDRLGKSRSLPKYLTTTVALERTSDGGVRFPGVKKHYDFTNNLIVTKDRDFLDRNFVFEVLVTFGPEDGIAHIGFGTGRQEGSANRRENSVFMRFHSPSFGEGRVDVEGSQKPAVTLGQVPQKGVHLVRMTKEGDSLTFEVDPENDGPTDDDLETVIPDIREYLPSLNSKNCQLFLGGTATFVSTRLEIVQ